MMKTGQEKESICCRLTNALGHLNSYIHVLFSFMWLRLRL